MKVISHFILWSLGLTSAETQTTKEERDCLTRHARNKKYLVEIGVWHGVTTSKLRKVMANDGTLLAVDPYPIGRLGFSMQQLIAHSEVRKIRNGCIKWIRKTGVEAAQDCIELENKIDFIFIDGDHSYKGLQEDWEAWRPIVAVNGIIALHDSRSSSTRNIDDAGSVIFTRENILLNPSFKVVETVDTVTILKRLK